MLVLLLGLGRGDDEVGVGGVYLVVRFCSILQCELILFCVVVEVDFLQLCQWSTKNYCGGKIM